MTTAREDTTYADLVAREPHATAIVAARGHGAAVPQRAPAPVQGYLAYDPAEVLTMAKQCARDNVSMGLTYSLGMCDDPDAAKAFLHTVRTDYEANEIDDIVADFSVVRDPTGHQDVTVRFWRRYDPPKPPLELDDSTTIYTNFNTAIDTVLPIVPPCSRDLPVTIVASDRYDDWTRAEMHKSKSKHRVMCGKFPRRLKRVLAKLRDRGVVVVEEHAVYM